MSETIIESVLSGKLDPTLLLRWLNRDNLEDVSDDCVLLCCDRNEFVTHFLSYLRRQTDSILQTNTSALQVLQHQNTPEKLLSARKHHRSISDPTYELDRSTDTLSNKADRKSHESPTVDKKRPGRRVKTKLFESEKSKDSISSDDSRLSSGIDRIVLSSTPMKNGVKNEFPNLPLTSPVTPHSKSYERCDTPRLSYRHSRSQEKSCLGDYLVSAQKSSKKKRTSRNVSDDSDIANVSKELDLSNSDLFPEIGARKSSSLKSDKRRIKPTNIEHQKSQSLNSFNSECFQQPSPLALEDNDSLTQKFQPNFSNSFDVERKILKQDKQKLIEKFNSLNTTATRTVTPQIRIIQKESLEKTQNFVKTEPTKITFKDKLDITVEIYDKLIRNNLILSMNMEIYYLISLLLSQQNEEEYIEIENKTTEDTIYKYLLKSIHNTTYFSVKTLWCQRDVLEVILDKNSLKLLGENKRVRSFCPELAKFLLNLYGLKCEAEIQDKTTPDLRATNGVVCFNFETDNVDNFPSMAHFQNFKKQRDMFYELLRWYSSGPDLTTLRSRVRALLSVCQGLAAQRLAMLIVAQVAQGMPQDSKLNKLARRLTRPATDAKNTHFSDQEMFYRDLLVCADSDSFRTHVKDALISEICSLNSNSLAGPDVTKDYIHLVKKLCLLSKFLSFISSLPYIQTNEKSYRDPYIAPDDRNMYQIPKEKVLDNNLVLRSFTQPNIDLKGILLEAKQNGRLSIAIPWIVQYLVILDYTSLRTKYHKELLLILFEIYIKKLQLSKNNYFNKNTMIYLKSILGWLCSQNQFPQEFFYEKQFSVASDEEIVQIDMNKIDLLDFVNENVINEICPYIKDIGVLLTTCRVPQEHKEIGSFRHITPVSLSLNPEERIKNKEKELQNRLEEQILRSMPSSSRRVLELLIDRMYHMRVREAARLAAEHADRAVKRIAVHVGQDHKNLVTLAETILMSEVNTLRNTVIASWQNYVKNNQLSQALTALSMEKVHTSLVAKGVQRRLQTKYSSTAILCKDIEGLVKSLSLSRLPSEIDSKDNCQSLTDDKFDQNVSVAQTVIDMVELVQSILFNTPVTIDNVISTLSASHRALAIDNVFSTAQCRHALLMISVDLVIALVIRRPADLTDHILSLLTQIWRHFRPETDNEPDIRSDEPEPDIRDFGEEVRAPTPDSSDDEKEPPKSKRTPPKIQISTKMVPPPSVKSPTTPNTDRDDGECAIFSRILCPRNISLLSTSTAQSWRALSNLIQYLRRKGFCDEQELAESCIGVYTQEYDKTTLENLSNCIKSISSSFPANSGKVALFFDFLSEYCIDMDVGFVE